MERYGAQRKSRPKGIPFAVPVHGQQLTEERGSSSTSQARSSVSSPFTPGRDNLKGHDKSNAKRHSRPESGAIPQSKFYAGSSGKKGLGSHMNGVPDSLFDRHRAGSSPTSRFDKGKAILEDRSQHRNANAHNHSQGALRRSDRQLSQKHRDGQSGAGKSSMRNGEAIVISDSENEDESGAIEDASDDDDFSEQLSPSTSRSPTDQRRDRATNRQAEGAPGEMPDTLRDSIQYLGAFSKGEPSKRRRIADDDAERDSSKGATSSKDISTSFFLPMRIAQDGDGDKLQRKVGLRHSMKDRNGEIVTSGPFASMKKRNTNESRPSSAIEPLRQEVEVADIPEEVVMPLRELCFHDTPRYFGESSEALATLVRGKFLKLEWTHDRTRHSVSIDLSNVSHIGVSDKHLSAMREPSGMRLAHFTVKDEGEQTDIVDALEITGLSTTRPRRQIDIVMFASGYSKDLHHVWLKFSRALEAKWPRAFSTLEQSQITLATSFVESCKNASTQSDSLDGSPAPLTKARPRARPSVPKDSSFAESPSAAQNDTLSEDENRSSNGRRSGSPERSAAQRPSAPERSAQTTNESRREVDDEKMFFYPFQGAGAVTVFKSDHARLDDSEFLNDTIIAFGLKYLMEKIKERDETLHSQIYVFSSFFYSHVISKGKAREEAYQKVKKWTSKVDLFHKKYLVVPINERLHWYLAIVVNPFNALSADQQTEYLRRRSKPEADQKTETASAASPMIEDRKEEVDRETNGIKSNTTDTGDSTSLQSDVEGSASYEDEEDKGRTDRLTAPSTKAIGWPITHATNTFAGEESAMFQSSDTDGDVTMADETSNLRRTVHTVQDLRKSTSDRQSMESISDSLENAGQGKVVGGGDEAKRRTSTSRNAIIVDDDVAEYRSGRPQTRSRSSAESSPHSLRSKGPLRELDLFKYDSKVEDKWRLTLREGAAVCVFDSLTQRHATVRKTLSDYLGFELRDKFDIKTVEPLKLEYIDVAAPKQPNFCDCGLYLLHTFERFFADTTTFLDEVIPKRDRHHEAWNAGEAAGRRKWWQKILRDTQEEFQMFQQQRKEERKRLKLAHAAATAENEKGTREGEKTSKEEESSTEGGVDS